MKNQFKDAPWGKISVGAIGAVALVVYGITGEYDPNTKRLSQAYDTHTLSQDMSGIAETYWNTCRPVVAADPNETAEQAELRYQSGSVEYVNGTLKRGEVIRDDRSQEPISPGTPVCDRASGAVSILGSNSEVTDIWVYLPAVGKLDIAEIEPTSATSGGQ